MVKASIPRSDGLAREQAMPTRRARGAIMISARRRRPLQGCGVSIGSRQRLPIGGIGRPARRKLIARTPWRMVALSDRFLTIRLRLVLTSSR